MPTISSKADKQSVRYCLFLNESFDLPRNSRGAGRMASNDELMQPTAVRRLLDFKQQVVGRIVVSFVTLVA
jgi:hypothetical protein